MANPNMLSEADTSPLVHLLRRNDLVKPADSPLLAAPDPIFPLCSSETTAMTLGLFAYKMVPLTLVQVRTSCLIEGKAPYAHPMGSFWFLKQSSLAAMMGGPTSRVRLLYAPFIISTTPTSPWHNVETVLRECELKAWQQKEKGLLQELAFAEQDVASVKEKLRVVQAALASFNDC